MKTAVRRILLLSALMSPGALYALGLGEIHLNSALNQPFDADIDLVSATQEDLGALRASLANGDTFAKYGLDRPGFLSDFSFRVAKGPAGQDVLKVTSPRPVTEPFVTLLVEASWPRGKLLREYTVLLDPPVFAPTPAASEPPVSAPRASSAATPASRPDTLDSSPAPTSGERRAPRSVAVASPSIEPGASYRVRPNDTLWDIASAANPGSRSDVNRAMVAIYQNNPHAFEGNINVLRAGSVLKIPESSDISSISASAASAEVARQYQMWKEGAAAAGGEGGATGGRLRLVTPEQGSAAPSTATSAPATPPAAGQQSSKLKARVGQLEAQLAEAKRLLEVKDAELATLQAQQAKQAAAPGAGEVEVKPPAGTSAEVPVPPSGETAAPAAEPAAQPAAATPKPEAAKPQKPKKKKAAPPPKAEPSLLDRLGEYWWVLLGLVAIVAGAALFKRMRGAKGSAETDLEEALGRDLRAASRAPVATTRASRDSDIVVEEKRPVESSVQEAPRPVEPIRKPVSIEDTLSGDGAASIEAGDPPAEADFHMAYGLYDQAADLVQLAIKREPRRRELKLKLLEIFFVWGNKDRFLELAREMGASRADAPAGEWDKVLIMGKQIAPEDSLFAGTPSAAPADLDMELHGGTGSFDINLDGETRTPTDIDLTGSMPKLQEDASLDFVLDEPQRGAADPASLAPTVEMPHIPNRGDDTEELPIENLGIEVDSLSALHSLEDGDATLLAKPMPRAVVEDTVENPRLRPTVEDTVENPRLRPAVEDTIESPTIEQRRAKVDDTVEEDLLSSTSLMKMNANFAEDLTENTSETAILDVSELGDPADALPRSDQTARFQVPDDMGGVDFVIGEEAATMSEVGTKLDLARAYIDMGDPEGARSILEEVLKEGNASQKQEAMRLMSSLP